MPKNSSVVKTSPQDLRLDVTDLHFSLPYITGRASLSKMNIFSAVTSTMLQRRLHETKIIKGINLSLKLGDRVGLIGKNGAGKSTLLRLLAGAYDPTSGQISSVGKITSLISVSAGFNRMATGHENIVLRGLNLDMTMEEIRAKTDAIIDFSELSQSIHKPLYTYSDGMRARLAFAIVVETDTDILLLDEWLGAGDQDFQDKAAKRMLKFVENSGITVLASHNKRIISQVCNRIVELEDGKVLRDESLSQDTNLPVPLKVRLKEQIQTFEKQFNVMRSEKQTLQKTLRKHKAEVKALRFDLDALRKRKNELLMHRKEQIGLNESLERVRNRLERVRNRKEELRVKVKIQNKEKRHLKDHNKALKEKIAKLKAPKVKKNEPAK